MFIKKKDLFFVLLIVIVFLCGIQLFTHIRPMVDESIHYLQILEPIHKEMKLPDHTPQIPGYHWTLTLFSLVTKTESGAAFRIVSSVLSFFTVLSFFLLAKKVESESAIQKSMQLLFMPVLFTYFFILYTDAYSLLWTYLSILAVLNRRYTLSGLFSLLSIMVRQNNVVWSVFLCVFIYLDNNNGQSFKNRIVPFLKRCWIYLAGFVGFGIFMLINKGLVLGDRSQQSPGLHPGNIFFGLFIFFFLFLPHNILNAKRIALLLKKEWKKYSVVLGFTFFAYLIFFKTREFHLYNDPAIFSFFLRNRLLEAMTSSALSRLLAFLVMAYSILSIAATPLLRKSYYLIYPFSLLFLLPLGLIEHRYCLIPYTLFLLFKEKEKPVVAYLTVILYVIINIVFLNGIARDSFFL